MHHAPVHSRAPAAAVVVLRSTLVGQLAGTPAVRMIERYTDSGRYAWSAVVPFRGKSGRGITLSAATNTATSTQHFVYFPAQHGGHNMNGSSLVRARRVDARAARAGALRVRGAHIGGHALVEVLTGL